MEEIYKNVLLLVHSITQLADTTYMFSEDPTNVNGEKIIEIVDKCENKFLKVKEEIVKMIKEIESDKKIKEHKVKGIQTENGFLIKE